MPQQALAMSWDYAEGNPIGKSSSDITTCVSAVAACLGQLQPALQCAAGGVGLAQRHVGIGHGAGGVQQAAGVAFAVGDVARPGKDR